MMAQMSFTVLIEKDEDGVYIASVPALPGCHTQAKTIEDVYSRIKEAIELCVEVHNGEIIQNEFVGVQQMQIVI